MKKFFRILFLAYISICALMLINLAYDIFKRGGSFDELILVGLVLGIPIFIYIFYKYQKFMTKYILKSNFNYSAEDLNKMSLIELSDRYKLSRLDRNGDYRSLTKTEVAQTLKELTVKIKTTQKAKDMGSKDRKFVCMRCGRALGDYARGQDFMNKLLLGGGLCKKGGNCVPHEVPEGY